MRDLASHPELLAMNTATLGYRKPISEVIDLVAQANFGGIAPWRQELDEAKPEAVAKQIRDAGLVVSGYCRTAYLSGPTQAARDDAVAQNIAALETAAVLGAKCLIAVVGGLAQGSRDAADSRNQIIDGLAKLGETAAKLNMPIALEPLHPAYAADRSLLNTTAQAIEWCELLDPDRTGIFGICLDAYHIWWDPELASSIENAAGRILAYHVSDWLVEQDDAVLDRGMPGDGVIDLAYIRSLVEDAGYSGLVELEIFSANNWWIKPEQEVLQTSKQRMLSCC